MKFNCSHRHNGIVQHEEVNNIQLTDNSELKIYKADGTVIYRLEDLELFSIAKEY